MSIKYKHGIVIKLPDSIDPNELIFQKEMNEYLYCPFCGNTDIPPTVLTKSQWRRLSGKWWKLWEKIHWCKKLCFHCVSCGAKWESPWFPQDIKLEELHNKDNIDVDWLIKNYKVEN